MRRKLLELSIVVLASLGGIALVAPDDVFAVCTAKCREFKWFTRKGSATDPTYKDYGIVDGGVCKALIYAEEGEHYSYGTSSIKKYKEMHDNPTCNYECFYNGSTFGYMEDCEDVLLHGMATDINCFDGCTSEWPPDGD